LISVAPSCPARSTEDAFEKCCLPGLPSDTTPSRWVFLDFRGKGNKVRSVAVPLWVKQEIDGWLDVAGIEKGPIFRRVLANGRVGKDALTKRGVSAGAGVRSADRDRRAGAA
jgi:hypothetical protein